MTQADNEASQRLMKNAEQLRKVAEQNQILMESMNNQATLNSQFLDPINSAITYINTLSGVSSFGKAADESSQAVDDLSNQLSSLRNSFYNIIYTDTGTIDTPYTGDKRDFIYDIQRIRDILYHNDNQKTLGTAYKLIKELDAAYDSIGINSNGKERFENKFGKFFDLGESIQPFKEALEAFKNIDVQCDYIKAVLDGKEVNAKARAKFAPKAIGSVVGLVIGAAVGAGSGYIAQASHLAPELVTDLQTLMKSGRTEYANTVISALAILGAAASTGTLAGVTTHNKSKVYFEAKVKELGEAITAMESGNISDEMKQKLVQTFWSEGDIIDLLKPAQDKNLVTIYA